MEEGLNLFDENVQTKKEAIMNAKSLITKLNNEKAKSEEFISSFYNIFKDFEVNIEVNLT